MQARINFLYYNSHIIRKYRNPYIYIHNSTMLRNPSLLYNKVAKKKKVKEEIIGNDIILKK